jgi:uncharacterized repeat protein (TIGR03803 family)
MSSSGQHSIGQILHWRATVLRVAIVLVSAVIAARAAQAQTYAYSVLYRFQGNPDGAAPEAGLILDSSGNLYGTTTSGGKYQDCPEGFGNGCGTVFRLKPLSGSKWKETVLYSFKGDPDGVGPFAGLVWDALGSLYGTTAEGGASSCFDSNPCGTVFRLTRESNGTWREKVLHSFTENNDGGYPRGNLIHDPAGNLYGTTSTGGDSFNGYGTIFKISRAGVLTTLYTFTDGADGATSEAGLLRDSSGNYYGTTSSGGGSSHNGTVFKFDAAGTLTTLYAFDWGVVGGSEAGVIMDKSGNLYGTFPGDNGSDYGNVWQLSPSGNLTVLYSFTGGADGRVPTDGLIMDEAGSLYGTASFGGDKSCDSGSGCGVVYKLAHQSNGDRKLVVLHTFKGGSDGEVPYSTLLRDAAGNLYGTTVGGGYPHCVNRNESSCGIVFRLKVSQ